MIALRALERALSHFALFNPFQMCDEKKYVETNALRGPQFAKRHL